MCSKQIKNYIIPPLSCLLISVIVFSLMPLNSANAATVLKSQGQEALISFDGNDEAISKGDKYFVINSSGKKTGLIEIQNIKGNRATAKIIKGKVAPSSELKIAVAATNRPSSHAFPQGTSYGLLGGFAMDSQTVKNVRTTTESVKLSGTGLSIEGFFDYPLPTIMESLGFTMRAGLDQFTAKGTSNAYGAEKTNFLLLTLTGLAHIDFNIERWTPFLAAGLSSQYALTQSSNNLLNKNNSISTAAIVGGGTKLQLAENLYGIGQIEYAQFLFQTEVPMSYIALRVGAGLNF
jgi:hypothetical protein